MTSMLEKAIEMAGYAAEAELGGGHNAPVRSIAIAVLEAIRQPDDTMVRACGKAMKRHIESLPAEERKKAVGSDGLRLRRADKARVRFTAMIDAILAGEEPK